MEAAPLLPRIRGGGRKLSLERVRQVRELYAQGVAPAEIGRIFARQWNIKEESIRPYVRYVEAEIREALPQLIEASKWTIIERLERKYRKLEQPIEGMSEADRHRLSLQTLALRARVSGCYGDGAVVVNTVGDVTLGLNTSAMREKLEQVEEMLARRRAEIRVVEAETAPSQLPPKKTNGSNGAGGNGNGSTPRLP